MQKGGDTKLARDTSQAALCSSTVSPVIKSLPAVPLSIPLDCSGYRLLVKIVTWISQLLEKMVFMSNYWIILFLCKSLLHEYLCLLLQIVMLC